MKMKVFIVMVRYNQNTEFVKAGTETISGVFLSEKKALAYRDYWNKTMKDVAFHWITEMPVMKTDYSKSTVLIEKAG